MGLVKKRLGAWDRPFYMYDDDVSSSDREWGINSMEIDQLGTLIGRSSKVAEASQACPGGLICVHQVLCQVLWKTYIDSRSTYGVAHDAMEFPPQLLPRSFSSPSLPSSPQSHRFDFDIVQFESIGCNDLHLQLHTTEYLSRLICLKQNTRACYNENSQIYVV